MRRQLVSQRYEIECCRLPPCRSCARRFSFRTCTTTATVVTVFALCDSRRLTGHSEMTNGYRNRAATHCCVGLAARGISGISAERGCGLCTERVTGTICCLAPFDVAEWRQARRPCPRSRCVPAGYGQRAWWYCEQIDIPALRKHSRPEP